MAVCVTTAVDQITVMPFFLSTPGGRLFAAYHRPTEDSAIRGQILCIPPFNEEMNRCRSMITLQAQAFAKLGFATLLVDLHGTGDSEGEYNDARWSIWLDNLNSAKEWLDSRPGGCQVLWGIRLGAILAAELHTQLATSDIRLIFWQAVADGKMHLTQFFRVRIAAQMDKANAPKETTTSMREQLSSGLSVEVAGYEIHPELAKAIDDAHLAKLPLTAGTQMLWLENIGGNNNNITPASRNLLARWPGDQVDRTIQGFLGPAFWQTHERVVTPAIIEQTTSWLSKQVTTI